MDNRPLYYVDVNGSRNMVVDFLIGGCLDLFENWDCSSAGEKAFNMAMCALDISSFIPGLQALKGAKAAKMAGKAAKGASKASKAANKANKMNKAEKGLKPKKTKEPEMCGFGRKECGPVDNLFDKMRNLQTKQSNAGEKTAQENASIWNNPVKFKSSEEFARYERNQWYWGLW